MKKIGIVSCEKWKEKIQEDILLQQILIKLGLSVNIIAWEDKNINYSDYSHLIIRSVWGYQNNYAQFKKWLLFVNKLGIKVFNEVDMILNNIKKDKQFQILDKYSIPHIPTTFIKSVKEFKKTEIFENDTIIKPIISGSGDNTYRITTNETILSQNAISKSEIYDVYSPILSVMDSGIMIQPYVKEIENGEFACIFIDGINTHNMLRFPGVFSKKQKPIYLDNIPEEVNVLANKVASLKEFRNHLYMRVDIVYRNNTPTIMEVELAEPDLLIKYIENEAIRNDIVRLFGESIVRRL